MNDTGILRRLPILGIVAAALLHAPESDAAESAGSKIVAKHVAIFTAPPTHVPTRAMPDGPLLGNGDIGVVIGGPPEAQQFYIGKNDFWPHITVINVGRIDLNIPALAGASYRQEQDLAKAEVRGTFTKDALTVRTRSWVQATENLLVTELQCVGQPVTVSLRHSVSTVETKVPASVQDNDRPVTVGCELHGGERWHFAGEIADVVVTNVVLSGRPAGQPGTQTPAKEIPAPKMDQTVSVAAWIRISAVGEANYIVSKGEWNEAYSLGLAGGRLRWAINGTFVATEEALPTDKWLYVVGTFDGNRMCVYVDGALEASSGGLAQGSFRRQIGARTEAVAMRVLGKEDLDFVLKPGETVTMAAAILSDLDATNCLPAAQQRVAEVTTAQVAKLQQQHRQWWTDFWARSFVEIPDKEIEKRWYGALYVMGSCSRPGKVAPGLWGNWLTTDDPMWHGDYHLNYNFQAPFYIVFASNHADLSLPYCDAVNQFMPRALKNTATRGWKGIHLPVSIGPWGLCPEGDNQDFGQRSNAAYAALNFIWYWQYTQDDAWLKKDGYPYLRAVADFWEDYLKLEEGRYVIHSDAIHEGSGDNLNPILSLGLVRALFRNMLVMSAKLGVDADKRAKWQDILSKISAFPTQERDGKTVFRYTEKGVDWWRDNTLGIQHIFPAGEIGLGSDPKLLEISRNTIDAMSRWSDPNGFSSWYSACARVGYDPQVILARLRQECDTHSMPNLLLRYNGGGLENVSGFLAINEMLLQSHEGVLRFFPVWPKGQDAKFGNLRTVGAFLVSAELKGGVVRGVKIVSEKGRNLIVQNPWTGQRQTFKTKPGEVITLKAR